jgi:tRNA A37 threonylcarbamoyladenosine biosynthesis protein TsaE
VVVAEWGNRFPELMPPQTIWLEIRHLPHGREVRRVPTP